MLIQVEGVYKKLLCPECKGDNIGESGLGGSLVHCFGNCMMDFSQDACGQVTITSSEEIEAHKQSLY